MEMALYQTFNDSRQKFYFIVSFCPQASVYASQTELPRYMPPDRVLGLNFWGA